ncbi:MAG TPA: hypothetical protein VEL28_22680 [Candidatus Binatia bacterium]|nr:hypothetical protein [Candidatus Binatia bacterium]
MPRIHLFEFEDQPWCPPALRNAVTGYIRLVVQMTQQVRPVIPALAELLGRTGESRILDLCSGSGGIARQVAQGLARSGAPTPMVLTDLYPDHESLRCAAAASGGLIEAHAAPLNATQVPADLPGLRTIFNAFHHFDDEDARRILIAAAEARRPIAVIEFIQRNPMSLAGIFFSPFLVLFLAPFLRPLRWQTLVFTYLMPLIPLMVFWDGLASWLRVHSLRELEELAASVPAPDYRWEVGRWPVGPLSVTYLLGHRA